MLLGFGSQLTCCHCNRILEPSSGHIWFVFSFQFLVFVSLEYLQNGLYKLSNEVIQQNLIFKTNTILKSVGRRGNLENYETSLALPERAVKEKF